MKQPQCKWVDMAVGGPAHRNNVVEITNVLRLLPEKPTDCYVTWHRFPDRYKEIVESTKTVKNYKGISYADYLPFDFDHEDLGYALDQARQFIQMLEVSFDVNPKEIRCFFSGAKGFHVVLPANLFGDWIPSPKLHRQLRSLALALCDGYEVDTAIYDQNRLWRIPNTINSKSGLYKIPLTSQEILFLEAQEIFKIAVEPRSIDFVPYGEVSTKVRCQAMWQKARNNGGDKRTKPDSRGLFEVNLAEGEGRDIQAFKIACKLRDAGLSPDMALDILELWDRQLEDSLTATDGADILEKKIKNAYGDKPEGQRELSVYSLEEMEEKYAEHIERLKRKAIKLGFPALDLLMRGVVPGEVVTVIARSGVGKSAFLQNVIWNIVRSSECRVLFASLEQPLAQCYERWAQIVANVRGEEIESSWDNEAIRHDIALRVRQELGRSVYVCGVPALTLADLEMVLDLAQDKAGTSIDVLAIDYLGLIDAHDLDRTLYGQVSKVARALKDLAKKREIVVLVAAQVSRMGGEDGTRPLTLSSARESGAIEEATDYLLGLYRPDMEAIKEATMAIQLLKNRKGATGSFTYDFHRGSLRILDRDFQGG